MGEPIATVGELAGICGHDGTDWIKALIDATGHLQIDVIDSGGADLKDILDKLADILTELNAKLETADLDLDASGRLSANDHHYDGSAWRKSNLLWGYHDNYLEEVYSENVAAGTHQLDGTDVPTGEVWVVTALAGWCSTTNPSNVQFGIDRAGTRYFIESTPVATAWVVYSATGFFVLKAGDNAFVRFQSCLLDDDIYGTLIGYKMDISM